MTIDNMANCLRISFDLPEGAAGYVVVDTAVNNTSSGGVRVADDIAIDEIAALAREMTLKFSFIGLPRGGAKSGVRLPAGIGGEDKRKVLREFGRRLAPLIRAGLYFPGMDMNCGPDDLRAIYAGAGFTLNKITDTSFFTAVSVANAIEAVREACGDDNRPLTLAIEGFGSVGAYLAERLPKEAYRIVALSTIKGAVENPSGFAAGELVQLRKEYGDDLVGRLPGGRPVPPAKVVESDVDILVPAARILSINDSTMHGVKARFVVPAANAPYTDAAITCLHEKGIVCLPGFVTNSGGVFASGLNDSGLPVARIEEIAERYYRSAVRGLLKRSAELGESPVRLAERVAVARLAKRLQAGTGRSRSEKLYRKLFEKGIMPGSFHGGYVARGFVNNLIQLERQIISYGHD